MTEDATDTAEATQLSKNITDKDIRQLLVELTKIRASELLNKFSDAGMDNRTLTLIGTSTVQVALIRTWLEKIAVPELTLAIMARVKAMREAVEEKKNAANKAPADEPEIDTIP